MSNLEADGPPKCPNCGSKHLTTIQKGDPPKKTKWLMVFLTDGLFGLGDYGSQRVELVCLKCGHNWHPGDQ